MKTEKLMLSYWEYMTEKSYEISSFEMVTYQTFFTMYRQASSHVLATFSNLTDIKPSTKQKLIEKYYERVAEDKEQIREAISAAGQLYIAPEHLYHTLVEDIQQQCFDMKRAVETIIRVEEALDEIGHFTPRLGLKLKEEMDDPANPIYGKAMTAQEVHLKRIIMLVDEQVRLECEDPTLSEELDHLMIESALFRLPNELMDLYMAEELLEQGTGISNELSNSTKSALGEGWVIEPYQDYIDYRPLPDKAFEERFENEASREEAYALLAAIHRWSFECFRWIRSMSKPVNILDLKQQLQTDLYDGLQAYVSISPKEVEQLFEAHFWTATFIEDFQKVLKEGFYKAAKTTGITPIWTHKPMNRRLHIRDGEGHYVPITLTKETNLLDLFEVKAQLEAQLEADENERLGEGHNLLSLEEIDVREELESMNRTIKNEIEEVFRIPIIMMNLTDYKINIILFEKWFGPLRDQMMRLYVKSLTPSIV